MTESPTETLRRAASSLRSLAAAAKPGPWHALTHGTEVFEICNHPPCFVPGAGVERSASPTADYIGTVNPRVGLALADWLDAEARAHDGGMGVTDAVRDLVARIETREHGIQVAVSTLGQALAVARAVLGEEATT